MSPIGLRSRRDQDVPEQASSIPLGGKSKIAARLHARILRRLDVLNAATRLEELDVPGFDFHALKGFDPTRYTMHVNGPWCVTFAFDDGDAYAVDFEQYH
jgi:proteic killer suppression protein